MATKELSIFKKYHLIQHHGLPVNISRGTSSTVQLATFLDTQEIVAIKKINRKIALSQVSIQMKLKHPNIIKVLDSFFDQANQVTYIVLQYAQKGSLYDYIVEKGPLDKLFINEIFLNVCHAVKYIHNSKIMHRDLKPQNILVTKENFVKVCDFGLSTTEAESNFHGGTFEYMAPEALLMKKYDYKFDIWSLGILYFQLIQGVVPFRGNTAKEVLDQMRKSIYFSQKFRSVEIDLIKRILKFRPQDRLQIDQILLHPALNILKLELKSQRSTIDSQKKIDSPRKMRILSTRSNTNKKQFPRQMHKIQAFNLPNELILSQNQKIMKQKISLKTVMKNRHVYDAK